MTTAKTRFDEHIRDAEEAVTMYEYLSGGAYSADFALRFAWVCIASSVDSYITDLILEKGVESLFSDAPTTKKLRNESVSLSVAMALPTASPASRVQSIRSALGEIVRYRTFQKPDDIADGLSYVWEEKHKWQRIAGELNVDAADLRRKVLEIMARRDLIVHSMDYDLALGRRLSVSKNDAQANIQLIKSLVATIEKLVSQTTTSRST
ncbi:hypothetical protein [Jannaschia sp. W003]|uniref:hypothetical protein n=1 Tax=Jannaschia sp. W003 TaxID=2867012 RepID=UPI0021A27AB7|nr:hypothetical protein [Jannaschia sp. W003]UWQ21286.1 hypothetical protein K3554_15135 [Jannaschia sp. W003]